MSKNMFAALLEPEITTSLPKRGVTFKPSAKLMANANVSASASASVNASASASGLKRKPVYRNTASSLVAGLPEASTLSTKRKVQKLPCPGDFPQLAPAPATALGVWANTSTIHAAASLPDPAIAQKAALAAEKAQRRSLINMYKSVVHIGDEGRSRSQPQRRRLRGEEQDEQVDPYATCVIGSGHVKMHYGGSVHVVNNLLDNDIDDDIDDNADLASPVQELVFDPWYDD
jgi:hypothetical protein